MPVYTVPQYPEILLNVRGSNRDKSTYQALKKLVCLINKGTLNSAKLDRFNSKNFIEIIESDLMAQDEDAVVKAVKILSKLAVSRQVVQELHEQSLAAYRYIDILFGKDRISTEVFQEMQENFKILKEFAVANLRYKEALGEAEQARLIVDNALKMADKNKG
jgi:hypothetical protein